MAKTSEQELIDQMAQLYGELKVYKKVQANLAPWVDTFPVSACIEKLETDISELEIKLEVLRAIPSLNLPGTD
jgi:hypothetical protein